MFFQKRKEKRKAAESALAEERAAARKREEETAKALEALTVSQEDVRKALRRQMDAFEDFLDGMEEKSAGEQRADALLAEAAARESALVQAVCVLEEQMYLLSQAVPGSLAGAGGEEQAAAWEKQFALMEKERDRILGLADIRVSGTSPEPFDYRIHDALDTVETEADLDGRVARVYSPGFLYRGEVVKKATVSVYRRK